MDSGAVSRPNRQRGLKVVTRPGDGLGFRLAGVEVEELAPGAEAERLRQLLSDPSLGVVAVEARLVPAAPVIPFRQIRERGLPVLLPFALPRSWREPARGREYVAALIRRAIGYHIRLGAEASR
jgi:V/A-type H+-transporting ATPase subunit F